MKKAANSNINLFDKILTVLSETGMDSENAKKIAESVTVQAASENPFAKEKDDKKGEKEEEPKDKKENPFEKKDKEEKPEKKDKEDKPEKKDDKEESSEKKGEDKDESEPKEDKKGEEAAEAEILKQAIDSIEKFITELSSGDTEEVKMGLQGVIQNLRDLLGHEESEAEGMPAIDPAMAPMNVIPLDVKDEILKPAEGPVLPSSEPEDMHVPQTAMDLSASLKKEASPENVKTPLAGAEDEANLDMKNPVKPEEKIPGKGEEFADPLDNMVSKEIDPEIMSAVEAIIKGNPEMFKNVDPTKDGWEEEFVSSMKKLISKEEGVKVPAKTEPILKEMPIHTPVDTREEVSLDVPVIDKKPLAPTSLKVNDIVWVRNAEFMEENPGRIIAVADGKAVVDWGADEVPTQYDMSELVKAEVEDVNVFTATSETIVKEAADGGKLGVESFDPSSVLKNTSFSEAMSKMAATDDIRTVKIGNGLTGRVVSEVGNKIVVDVDGSTKQFWAYESDLFR